MQNEKLSITARYLLTYIRFRTNNNHPFFANNETIALAIGCTKDSTKVIINKLIREGYIVKTIDDKGRRNLSLSDKEFSPLDGVNMNSADKRILKQEIQNQERDANYYKQKYERAVEYIKKLENIIAQQDKVIKDFLQKEAQQKLEVQNPTPISRIAEPIEQQENQEPKQPQQSISQETPTTTDKIETSTEPQKTEEISQAVGRRPEEVIAEILGRPIEQQGFNNDYKK